MTLLIKLLLAHIIGDFILQPYRWVQEKEQLKARSNKLYFHVLIHAVLTYVLVCLITWNHQYFYIPIYIFMAHLVIDLLKISIQRAHTKQFWFFFDQALHLISIGAIWYYTHRPEVHIEHLNNPKVLFLITAVLILTTPASLVIKTIVNKWSPEVDTETNNETNTSLSNAGKFIGILERLFVLSFIIMNHLEAIGLLIAAKSLLRFGDLKKSHERKLTEYVLIGTLLSFGIAIVVGIVTQKILSGTWN